MLKKLNLEKFAMVATWKKTRKAVCISTEPVPQTDTGRQEEDSKANGRRVVKELGKLTP